MQNTKPAQDINNQYVDKYLCLINKALSSATPEHDIKELIDKIYSDGFDDGVSEGPYL